MKTCFCFLALGAAFTFSTVPAFSAPVIVHEWGTFTSLQDENGKAIGGINVDDEPVPWFVWNVAGASVVKQYASNTANDSGNLGLPPYSGGKGWVAGDPSVTMRLETPVLYLYPPKGGEASSVPPLDVHVDFHGGVLSEYYPYATATGLPMNGTIPYLQGKITGETTTGLTWNGVRIGVSGQLENRTDSKMKDIPWMNGQPIETDDKVWTTPREVSAPLLQVKASIMEGNALMDIFQTEHFLFYRGVGHLDSPLYLSDIGLDGGKMNSRYVWPQRLSSIEGGVAYPIGLAEAHASTYDKGWLVEIHSDGACAFREIASFTEGGESRSHPMTQLSFEFGEAEFKVENLDRLKASMQEALVKEGLYPDEASAMLHTWELSYFKSPGLRFFYTVPRMWVDKVLSLKITGAPTKITRVMIGRIELITAAQKAALARLAAGPCPDLAAVKQAAYDALAKGKLSKEEKDAFYSGEKPLIELGIPIPPLVRDYLSLGRFRDALIVHEEELHPTPSLAQFIAENQLKPLETIH